MHTHRLNVDCACADDLLPYVSFSIIYIATGDVVKVVYKSITSETESYCQNMYSCYYN